MGNLKKKIDKGISYFKRNGFQKTCVRMVRKLKLSTGVDYEKWKKKHTPSDVILEAQRKDNTGEKPVVSVQIFGDTLEMTEKTRKSVSNQTYGFLAVSEKITGSDYCLLIRDGAYLCEHAVYEMVKAAREDPQADLFYVDDDVMIGGHVQDPFLKPEFDSCMYLQWDYLGDVLFLKTSLAQTVCDLSDFGEVVEKAACIRRIPGILASVSGHYRIKRKLVERRLAEEPRISVIIPNMDHASDLKQCVESLIYSGGYENLEILIAENNSKEQQTQEVYRMLTDTYSCVTVISWSKPFDYAALNNEIAMQAEGEYLLFLNNDTKVKTEGFLTELMKWASLPKCGAVGARLLFADETLQHGGVVLGYGQIAGHAFEGMANEAYEGTVYAHLVRRMSAVTAACMLVKKEAFLEVGGFSDELRIAYNDVDLCMKLQKSGYMVLYDPYAQMYHFESQTRGLEMTNEKAKRVSQEAAFFCDRWREEIDAGDRFYNPYLTLEKPDFSLDR